MRHRLAAALAPAVALFACAAAQGQTFLGANLTNAAENPPTVPTLTNGDPRPASFGTAQLELNSAQTELRMTMTINNIDFTGNQSPDPNDNLQNAHIHAGPLVTPSTNGPVVWGFIGAPFNDTNPQDTVVTPFATGVGGTVVTKWDAPEGNGTTLSAQLTHILNNRAYLNFHTTQFPGGEIRGNIFVIPEPATAGVLLGAGALGLMARRHRVR